LAALETTRRASIDHTEVRSPSPTESAISSRVDAPAGITPRGHRRSDSKSGATLGTVHATALGTTSIAEDAQSGQSTPVPAGATPQPAHAAAPYSSTYDGKDPGVREYLEQVDLENYREPLLDLGPRVHATHRKRGPRPKASTPQSVTMIAHFPNHTGPVTAIVPSPDQLFFATASEDRTIHIWDNARLERSVSGKPRLTYRMDAPIAAMCRIEETHCLAAAAEDGTLHVLRVYVSTGGGSTTKYRGIEGIRTWRCSPEDGYVMHVTHLQGEYDLLTGTPTRTWTWTWTSVLTP
jgi:phosphoinositide-3-kinase regulatory subunit 4